MELDCRIRGQCWEECQLYFVPLRVLSWEFLQEWGGNSIVLVAKWPARCLVLLLLKFLCTLFTHEVWLCTATEWQRKAFLYFVELQSCTSPYRRQFTTKRTWIVREVPVKFCSRHDDKLGSTRLYVEDLLLLDKQEKADDLFILNIQNDEQT